MYMSERHDIYNVPLICAMRYGPFLFTLHQSKINTKLLLLQQNNILLIIFPPDWRGVIEREKFADAVLICTPDRLHKVNTSKRILILMCKQVCSLYLTISMNDLCSSFVPQDPAVAFARKGYHILLEKPMAVSVSLNEE